MDGKAEFSPELRNNLVPDSLTELEHELELELGNELEIELKLEVELAELALKFFNRKNILYDKLKNNRFSLLTFFEIFEKIIVLFPYFLT